MTIKAKEGELGEDQVAKISISHDNEYSTAVCLVAEEVEADITDMPEAESTGKDELEVSADNESTSQRPESM
jgi:hypothetical protein